MKKFSVYSFILSFWGVLYACQGCDNSVYYVDNRVFYRYLPCYFYKQGGVCIVSLEAIKSISAAEDEARQAKLLAQQIAREAIENVEKAGKETIASMVDRVESEIADLKRAADQKAEDQADEIASHTANRQATLHARAESRLDKAAQLIVERIVNT